MREVETIIVGGGISGLACADTLTRNLYRDFVLVSPDVGGRICTSNNGRVNYGAYYVRRDYHHLLPHVTRKRRLRAWRVLYLDDDKLRPIHASMLHHPVATARLLWHIKLFDRHYQRFKRNACMTPQRVVIEADPFLHDLYRTDAIDYLRKVNLADLQDGLINPIVWGTALIDIREISACTMLFLLWILIHPTWEFDFDPSRLIATFADRLIRQEVGSIQTSRRQWQVESRNGQQYLAANLVVALPIETSIKLLRLEWQVNKPLISWMVHVSGTPKSRFAKDRYIVLAPYGKDVIMARQADDSWIVHSRKSEIDLSNYFSRWKVIERREWRPAFYIGNRLIDCRIDEGAYVIGDHNAVSMEDSWITGMYAANQILARYR